MSLFYSINWREPDLSIPYKADLNMTRICIIVPSKMTNVGAFYVGVKEILSKDTLIRID